jgi:hypothetical protein
MFLNALAVHEPIHSNHFSHLELLTFHHAEDE